jgi:hypothetical protein
VNISYSDATIRVRGAAQQISPGAFSAAGRAHDLRCRGGLRAVREARSSPVTWCSQYERRQQLANRWIRSTRCRDVLDGYVSIQGAREDYGVIISADKAAVDVDATNRLRDERRLSAQCESL